MLRVIRDWLVGSVLRHRCVSSLRERQLETVINNLLLERRAAKAALAQRLSPYVSWEEPHEELQRVRAGE